MDFIKAERVLMRNGFEYVRTKGDHVIYKRDGKTVSITCCHLNEMLWKRIIKENNLK